MKPGPAWPQLLLRVLGPEPQTRQEMERDDHGRAVGPQPGPVWASLSSGPRCPLSLHGAHLGDESFGIECGFRIRAVRIQVGTVSATRTSEHLPAFRAGGRCWSLRGGTDFRKHRDPESPSRYPPTASRSEAPGWRGPADVHRPPGPEWAAGQKQIPVGESSWPWGG